MIRFPYWAIVPFLIPATVNAQTDQAQLQRRDGAAELNGHLAKLGTNPRDVASLIGAGEAALALDDPRAAAGFFARAETLQSTSGRVKAGLGRVALKMQNPGEALRLFDLAVRLGYPEASLLSDRGLARDMTGDQAGAQRDYQAAMVKTPEDDELARRYAASLGISGQIDASERVLKTLLYKSDRAAWRYRAFIYAMNNRQGDAKRIADDTMPAQLATAITPYMQKMPYLTAAQKAAAVHFGHFPAQIGNKVVAIIATPAAPEDVVPAPVQMATAQPITSQMAARDNRRSAAPRSTSTATRTSTTREPIPMGRPSTNARVAAATPPPSAPQKEANASSTVTPTVQASVPATRFAASKPMVQAIPNNAPTRVVPAAQPATQPTVQRPVDDTRVAMAPSALPEAVSGPPAPTPNLTNSQPSAQPNADVNPLNQAALARANVPPQTASSVATAIDTSVPVPQFSAPPPPVSTAPPPVTRTLADIIHAIDVPESETQSSVAAVDLSEIAQIHAQRRAERRAAAAAEADKAKKAAVAKAKAEADAKAREEAAARAKLAANPSRTWLQVGVGANRGALAFTLNGLKRKYTELASQSGWSATWGRTNRLLVGPYPNFAAAKEVEEKLKKKGADVFAWRSSAGEEVDRIGGN